MSQEQEQRLQQFYTSRVHLSGARGQRVEEAFSAVQTLVGYIVKWAFQSSTGLYPENPILVGSSGEGLQLQPEDPSVNFDFLIPVRFNPKLTIASGSLATEPGGYEHRLPTYMFRDEGVPVCRWGTKVLVDLEAVEEAHVEVHCHNKQAWLEDDEIDVDELNQYKGEPFTNTTTPRLPIQILGQGLSTAMS
uniref:Uncharacterized protein n=1 Tax=Sphaerodactylus townsendi TaxID=933632 RepID=A0ACB8EW64_9SAUR